MNREQKKSVVQSFHEALSQQSLVVVMKQVGLSAKESGDFRRLARQEGAKVQVVKNTLAKISVESTSHQPLQGFLKGPTLLVFSQDAVTAAKVAVGFCKKINQKTTLVGGVLDGKVVEPLKIEYLSSLPSQDVLRAQILSTLVQPAKGLLGTLQEPFASVVRLIQGVCEKSPIH